MKLKSFYVGDVPQEAFVLIERVARDLDKFAVRLRYLNLLKMAKGGLGMEIRKLVQKATRTKEGTMHSEPLEVGIGKSLRRVRISATPLSLQAAQTCDE